MSRIVHFEIPAQDFDKIAAFYNATFGWTISKWEGPMEHWSVVTGKEDTPGINGALYRPGNGLSGTVNTIGVDDVDAYVAKVTAAGGSVVHPKYTIPTAGYIAYCADIEGNVFGLWQDDPNAGQ